MPLAGHIPDLGCDTAVPQEELAAAEGSEEPEVPVPVLASSALPTSRSKFSFHGVSHQFLLLTTQHYCLLLSSETEF